MAINNNSARLFLRGETATFVVHFYEDAAQTIPVIPIDSASYPAYVIYDINNNVVQSGIGIPEITPGRYRAELVVPFDAPLSNDMARWRMEWSIVSDSNRQIDFVEEFDIYDTVTTASETREQKYISLIGNPYRTILRLSSQPSEVNLDVYKAVSNQKVVDNVGLGPGGIQYSPSGNSIVYYYDIDVAALIHGTYFTILWKTRDSAIDPQSFVYQNLTVVTPSLLNLATSLRMLIDKLQKRLGVVQSYEDSDLIEYLARGTELVNAHYPTTFFGVSNIPNALTVHHLLYSAWYGLQAQQLLSTELGFSFCIDENTLIPSSKGLVRAKNIVEKTNYRSELATMMVGNRMPILNEIIATDFQGTLSRHEIAACLKSNISPLELTSLMGKLKINNRRSCTGWDLNGISAELQSRYYGNVFDSIPSSHKLLTPYGYDRPTVVYRFENQKCLEISNSLGYPVISTHNHPFLVLNTTTFEMEWKRADELSIGDLVAINKNIPEVKGSTDLLEYRYLVDDLALPTSPDESKLPDTLTPELARLLGYLISEGDVTSQCTMTFSNSSMEIIKDYLHCLNTCFTNIKSSVHESKNLTGYGRTEIKKLMFVKTNSVRVRRFLYCLGLTYTKAVGKTIPDAILTAPLGIVAEFLKAFVDGDVCYSKHKRTDKSELQVCIFSSHSKQLLIDIQNVLLLFGIISTFRFNESTGGGYVRISGKSLRDYVEKVGFLFKGKNYNWDKVIFTPLRESMPELYFALKNNVRPLLGLNSKGWKNKKRYKIYWNHNAKACSHIRWEHIQNWWNDYQETIKELNSEVFERLKAFVDTEFLWKPVTEIKDAGNRTVIDPSFKSHGNILDHAFITGGMVTHNSGQTVTLDYDQSSGIADLAGRWQEFLATTLSPAKMALLRKNAPVGAVAGRGYRFNSINNIVYKIGSSHGGSSNLVTQLTNMGLLF